ncbi:MAG TPA: glycosyltransferase family 39 protein [Candidatus Paceibacterota bacterium]|nr:glycosyltransferase family 39 protein [Candidatus Paceibacterota bacterium]
MKTALRTTDIATTLDTEVRSSHAAAVRTAALLVLFIGIAAVFSAVLFVNQSLRLDESQSLWQSSRSVWGTILIVSHDVHVPLYHLLLHFSEELFGNGVPTDRMLSFIFFAAAIPVMYKIGSYAYGRSAGIFAALITAVSPFLNWYGNETRMYSMLMFITVLNQYYFIKIYRERRGGWWWYGATALIGSFVHYFFALVLLTQALFYFTNKKLFPRHTLRNFFIVAAIIVIAMAPWFYLVKQSGTFANSSPGLAKPTSIDIFNIFSQFLFGFQTDGLNTIIVALWPLAMLFGFLLLQSRREVSPETAYFFMGFAIPILGAYAVSVIWSPVFLARYLTVAVPSLYLFVSWMLSAYPRAVSRAAKTALVAAMVAGVLVQGVSAATPVKEDYRDASEYLTANAEASDIVIISAPFTIYPVDYYYRGAAAIATLPAWDRYVIGPIPAFSSSTLPAQTTSLTANHDRAWILFSYDQGYQKNIKDYFDRHFQLLDTKNFSPGMTLYLYQIRQAPNLGSLLQVPIQITSSTATSSLSTAIASSTAR